VSALRGAAVVEQARAYLGTPFEHQGRLKGVGIDCAGLVIGVARDLGIEYRDVDGYARIPSGGELVRELERQMDRVPLAGVGIGDVLVLRIQHDPQHLAIVSAIAPLAVVHAYAARGIASGRRSAGRCVEHVLDARWQRRIVDAFRFRGVS
jgi:NlpC/P60 family putative phage cell wall peptidase